MGGLLRKEVSAATEEGILHASCSRDFGRGCALDLFTVRLLTGLTDVDTALKECPILDGDTGSHYVAGKRAVAADIYAVAGCKIAPHLAEDDDFASIDIGRNNAVPSNRHSVAR